MFAAAGTRFRPVALRTRRSTVAGRQGRPLPLGDAGARRSLCQCEGRGAHRSAGGIGEGYAALRQASGMRDRRTKLSGSRRRGAELSQIDQ